MARTETKAIVFVCKDMAVGDVKRFDYGQTFIELAKQTLEYELKRGVSNASFNVQVDGHELVVQRTV